MIDLVLKLTTDGTLDRLLKAGLISPKICFYRDIYLAYDLLMKTKKNMKKEVAKQMTAEKFKIDPRTVHSAIKAMS